MALRKTKSLMPDELESHQFEVGISLSGTLNAEGKHKNQAAAKAMRELERALKMTGFKQYVQAEGFNIGIEDIRQVKTEEEQS